MRGWHQLARRWFYQGTPTSLRPRPCRPVLECLEERCLLASGFGQVNLASDIPGLAQTTDPNLVNPWGLTSSPTGPFWVANNASGVSDLLDGRGQPVPLLAALAPSVQSGATPTGTVFNSAAGFAISENGVSAPSRFLFAAENGTISGWSEVVDPSHALVAVDNSSSGAVYKGLALATGPGGQDFLYAADFGRGTIDVFDQHFQPTTPAGSFQDPNLPARYAPFSIHSINNQLFVSYARQAEGRHDDVAGSGAGFIDVFDTSGKLERRFASQGELNAPWGVAVGPASFGALGGAVLVGNNGDGRINAYDAGSGGFLGALEDGQGNAITISNLWSLSFGNGHEGGAADTLFFTAGVGDEQHGLFGAIQSPGRVGADTAGAGVFDPTAPGEPADYPLPPRGGPALQDSSGPGLPITVLLPRADSSLLMIPTLTPFSGPASSLDAPIAAVQVVGDSVPGTSAVAWGTSDTLLRTTGDEAPSTGEARNSSLPLHAFLDWNSSQTVPEGSAEEVQPRPSKAGDVEAGRVATEVRSQDAEGSSRTSEVRDSGLGIHEEQTQLPSPATHSPQVPSAARSHDSTGDRTSGDGDVDAPHGGWRGFLQGVLVAVGVPLIWAMHPARVIRSWLHGKRRS
jgi:uncharacterized protein (TIGR03118 family)